MAVSRTTSLKAVTASSSTLCSAVRSVSRPARTVASAALTALTVRKPRNSGCTMPTW